MSKLLMITGSGGGTALAQGVKGAFYNTMEEFHRHWDRVDVVCPPIFNFQFSIFNFLKPKTCNLKPTTCFGNVFIHPSPWPLWLQSLWILKKGRQIYKEQKFDLITVHEYPPFYNGFGARLLWRKIKVPYVLEILHVPGYPRASNIKEYFYRWWSGQFISWDAKHATAVRVMNKKEVPMLLKKHGVPSGKIKLIPALYIDLDTFKPLGLEKKFDLIFVGRWERNKGLDLFLETVKKIDLSAIIVGGGSLESEIKLKIENYKLKINLYGWAKNQAEVAELINQSRILVMPSYNEGGPRVVAEALACGVPVVATPVGVVPDIVEGQTGEICRWSVESIAEKTQKLLTDPQLYRQYSLRGPEIVKQFEKKAAIENYADQLKMVIQKL